MNGSKKRGGKGKKTADRPRQLAVEVLVQVHEDDAFANLILPKVLRVEQQSNRNFDFRDSAFTSELVYGTLRQQGYLDAILGSFTTRPLGELDPAVLQLLRVGAYQLLFMRVPDHAAVSETVAVAREMTTEGAVRMINAVLRSITRASEEEIANIFEVIRDEDARLAAQYSHPEWMVQSFREALTERGFPESALARALEANNTTPRVNLIARPGLIEASELTEEVEDILQRSATQGNLSEYAVILDGGDPAALPSVRSGVAAVQDEGSQIAALMLAEAPLEGADELWLDLCAGPGGKSALLGALAAKRGAEVVANEVSPHRARLVERSVQALTNVTVQVGDGRQLPLPKGSLFDRVLVDAPCSGLGSLRRRPESRWRRNPSEIDDLVPLQRELLQRGWEVARPGAVIAWVTCTPQISETSGAVSWALESGEVELIDAVEVANQLAVTEIASPGEDSAGELVRKTVQLWPHIHGTDAMFIALLRKI